MFFIDDFDIQVQSDELITMNELYWIENEEDWRALRNEED